MRIRDMRLTLAAFVLGALSCAGPAAQKFTPVSEPAAPDPRSSFLAPELIGEAPGIAAPEDGTWRSGDALIYGITLKTPSHSRKWLLRIEVVSPPEAAAGDPPQVLLEVDAFDGSGKAEQSDRVLAPAAELEYGLYPGCRLGGRVGTHEEMATVVRSLTTVQGYFHLTTSALKPVVDAVVARPPLLDILLHAGAIRLGINVEWAGAEMPSGLPDFPEGVCSFPFRVRVYDSPALEGRIFVTGSRPPFLPGGGIVAIEARHPRDPASTVSVRLLAAKRGPAAAVAK